VLERQAVVHVEDRDALEAAGPPGVDPDRGFRGLGFSSLMAVELGGELVAAAELVAAPARTPTRGARRGSPWQACRRRRDELPPLPGGVEPAGALRDVLAAGTGVISDPSLTVFGAFPRCRELSGDIPRLEVFNVSWAL
jgi:hypothetical protein